MNLLRIKPKEIQLYGFIYSIRNNANNSFYVGQTILSVGQRFGLHKTAKYNSVIKNAINKYGPKNFTLDIIGWATTPEILDIYEIKAIRFYQSNFKSYNVSSGGQFNCKITKEIAMKISKALKGKKKTPEHIEKVRLANIGNKRTEEQINASSERMIKIKGRKITAIDISGNVFNFNSINAAVKKFGIVKQQIRHSLNSRNIVENRLVFFYSENYDSSIPFEKFFFKYKLTNNVETIYFVSLRQVYIQLGVSEGSAYKALKTGNILNYKLERI